MKSWNNARELTRHINEPSPNLHANTNPEAWRSFCVPHSDWLKDKNLGCTKVATDTATWYQAFETRGYGLNWHKIAIKRTADAEAAEAARIAEASAITGNVEKAGDAMEVDGAGEQAAAGA